MGFLTYRSSETINVCGFKPFSCRVTDYPAIQIPAPKDNLRNEDAPSVSMCVEWITDNKGWSGEQQPEGQKASPSSRKPHRGASNQPFRREMMDCDTRSREDKASVRKMLPLDLFSFLHPSYQSLQAGAGYQASTGSEVQPHPPASANSLLKTGSRWGRKKIFL